MYIGMQCAFMEIDTFSQKAIFTERKLANNYFILFHDFIALQCILKCEIKISRIIRFHENKSSVQKQTFSICHFSSENLLSIHFSRKLHRNNIDTYVHRSFDYLSNKISDLIGKFLQSLLAMNNGFPSTKKYLKHHLYRSTTSIPKTIIDYGVLRGTPSTRLSTLFEDDIDKLNERIVETVLS